MSFEPVEPDAPFAAYPRPRPVGTVVRSSRSLASFIGRSSLIAAAPTAIFSLWWWINRGGRFVEGCSGQAVYSLWNLIGNCLMAAAGLTAVLGIPAIVLGQKFRGWVASTIGIVILGAFMFLSATVMC